MFCVEQVEFGFGVVAEVADEGKIGTHRVNSFPKRMCVSYIGQQIRGFNDLLDS